MKSRTEYLTFNIPSKMAFENITSSVAAIVRKSGVPEGLVVLLDRGDLGEKLVLNVLGQAVGVGEFGEGEEAVHPISPPSCRLRLRQLRPFLQTL